MEHFWYEGLSSKKGFRDQRTCNARTLTFSLKQCSVAMMWQYRQKNVQLAREKLCTLRSLLSFAFEINLKGCIWIKKFCWHLTYYSATVCYMCMAHPVIRTLTGFYILFTYQCPACEGSVFPFTVLNWRLIVRMFRVNPSHSSSSYIVKLTP